MSELTEQPNSVAKIARVSALKTWLADGARAHFAGNKAVSQDTAEQLALGAVIAAETAIENSKTGVTWKKVDTGKFVADVFRMIGYGLDFANKEVYVVPYRNPSTGLFDLTTPISADGLVKLARKYSIKPIGDFFRFIVRDGDEISLSYGTKPDWTYKPVLFKEGTVLGYLTVINYEDGTCNPLITTKEEVERRRAKSKAPNSPAWTDFYDYMALAKATRRHMKLLSIDLPKEFLDDDEDDYNVETKDMGEAPVVTTISLEEIGNYSDTETEPSREIDSTTPSEPIDAYFENK